MDSIDVLRQQRILEKIKNRYFHLNLDSPSDSGLSHHGDCSIYRSIRVYGSAACTCGFLHDLRLLNEDLKVIIHPDFYDELMLEDGPPPTEIGEAIQKTIHKFVPEYEEIDSTPFIGIIKSVFGDGFGEKKEREWATRINKN